MLSYAPSQLSLLDSPHYNVYLQTLLKKPNGEIFSFFDYGGTADDKRMVAATVTASMDMATIEGTVTFTRGLGSQSLSPYIRGSFFNSFQPLMWPGTEIFLYVAIVAPGATPVGPDFRIILHGRIDHVNVNAGPDQLQVRYRDEGGPFLNRWIETPRPYGSAAGTAVEAVMNQICQDMGMGFGPIAPGAASGFMVRQYMQERMPVLEALRRLAQQIGWDLRHVPRFGRGLVFQDPNRDNSPSQFRVHPNLYLGVTKLDVTDDDVRNVWRIGYPGAPGEPPTLFVTVLDQASIDRYGRRLAEIVEDRSSNINTLAEATFMAQKALADTKDPLADFSVELLPFPCVELNDVYTFAANQVHHSDDQVWAISGYEHNFADGSGRTKLFTRGKPIAAYRDYRRGQRRQTHISLNDAPTATYLQGVDYPEGTLWLKTASYAFPT